MPKDKSHNSRGFTAAQFQLPGLKEQAGGRRGTGASLLASPPSGAFCHIHIAQVRNSPHPKAAFLPSRSSLLTCVAPTATLPLVVPSPSHSLNFPRCCRSGREGGEGSLKLFIQYLPGALPGTSDTPTSATPAPSSAHPSAGPLAELWWTPCMVHFRFVAFPSSFEKPWKPSQSLGTTRKGKGGKWCMASF